LNTKDKKMKALISPNQNNFVVQVEPDENIFEIGLPLYWTDCPDDIMAYQYQYIDSQFVAYIAPAPTADKNKATAVSLLQQTDWTTIADVSNPQTANPYLANQAEFIAWRSQVRAIAVTPVDGVFAVFNEMPQEVWQTV
jgi:hypothetical protein